MPRNAALIPGELIALRANARIGQIEDPAKLPTRMVVFPWGEHKTAKGSFNVNEVTLSALPANQALSNFDRVVLDFDHNTVPGSATYKGEPAAIAATARVVCLSGEGIVYEDIEWTAEGRQFIGGGHYRDLSPAVKRDAKNNVIFLHSAAACRQGAVPGLILFSADQTNPTTTNTMPDFKKLLCAILDLDPEKATDEEIQSAAEKAANEEEVEEVKPDGDEKPTVESLSAKIVTLELNTSSRTPFPIAMIKPSSLPGLPGSSVASTQLIPAGLLGSPPGLFARRAFPPQLISVEYFTPQKAAN